MEAGFDIQLPLYRLMATNGSTDGLAEDVKIAIHKGAIVGIAYFMLDDGRALTDAGADLGITNQNWRPIAVDISGRSNAGVSAGASQSFARGVLNGIRRFG